MVDIIQTKAWAFESKFFNSMAPIILHRITNGGNITSLINREDNLISKEGTSKQIGKNLYWSNEEGYYYKGDVEGSIIARYSLKGGITKNGGLCSMGTKHLGELLQLGEEKEKVKGHLIEIDSPGGAVDGIPDFAEVIRNLKKPVVVFVDGLMASAAYWVGSQADWVVTNKFNYTEVGSIGTLCTLIDEQGWLKKEGLKVEIMRAEQSKDKALLNSIEDWPKENLEDLQKDLNLITNDFILSVKSGRKEKLNTGGENIFSGKMYNQQKALELGMIDQIGTIEDAIKKAISLSKGPVINSTTKPNSKTPINTVEGKEEAKGAKITLSPKPNPATTSNPIKLKEEPIKKVRSWEKPLVSSDIIKPKKEFPTAQIKPKVDRKKKKYSWED